SPGGAGMAVCRSANASGENRSSTSPVAVTRVRQGTTMAQVGEPSADGQKLTSRVVDLAPPSDDVLSVSANTFEEQFGESIVQTLDVSRWRLGNDLDREYQRIEREVREAEKIETAKDKQIREELLPRLAALPNMPKNAGKHETTPENIASVQQG